MLARDREVEPRSFLHIEEAFETGIYRSSWVDEVSAKVQALKRSKGYRTKTRTILRRHPRDRGKIALGRLLIAYSPGQKVRISINPAIHKGMPHRRYHGRVGVVAEKRGRSYVVEVTSGKSPRSIIARPEHIEPVEAAE